MCHIYAKGCHIDKSLPRRQTVATEVFHRHRDVTQAKGVCPELYLYVAEGSNGKTNKKYL